MLRQTRIIRFYIVILPLWPSQSFLPTAAAVAGHRITAGEVTKYFLQHSTLAFEKPVSNMVAPNLFLPWTPSTFVTPLVVCECLDCSRI